MDESVQCNCDYLGLQSTFDEGWVSLVNQKSILFNLILNDQDTSPTKIIYPSLNCSSDVLTLDPVLPFTVWVNLNVPVDRPWTDHQWTVPSCCKQVTHWTASTPSKMETASALSSATSRKSRTKKVCQFCHNQVYSSTLRIYLGHRSANGYRRSGC